jgi:hypothetical protein
VLTIGAYGSHYINYLVSIYLSYYQHLDPELEKKKKELIEKANNEKDNKDSKTSENEENDSSPENDDEEPKERENPKIMDENERWDYIFSPQNPYN